MRLREMYTRLQTQLPGFPINVGAVKLPNGQNGVALTGLLGLKSRVIALASVPPLHAVMLDVIRHPYLSQMNQDQLVTTVDDGNTFTVLVQNAQFRASVLLDLLTSVIDEETDTTFAVEMPRTDSSTGLADEISEVSQFLEGFRGIPYGEGEDKIGTIALSGVDVGSWWIVFAAEAPAILNMIGWVLRAAQEMLDWNMRRAGELEAVKAMNLDTASVVENTRMMRGVLARKLADQVKGKTGANIDNETLNRMALLIEQGSSIIERRYLFQASRKALPTVVAAFPPAEAPTNSADDLQLTAPTGELKKLLGQVEPEKR